MLREECLNLVGIILTVDLDKLDVATLALILIPLQATLYSELDSIVERKLAILSN